MNRRISIIGGSGFVGTRLIDELGMNLCLNVDKCPSETFDKITMIHDIRSNGIENILPKKSPMVVLLAAEHKDDVTPVSLYYDVNVLGTSKVLDSMDVLGLQSIIFTSSVAVYGLNKNNPDENHPVDPFNHYGKSKWQAEEVLREWYYRDSKNRSLTIIRPTVIFGEANRGNVYNLLRQIASGKFLMIGNGENKKSMAYIGNVVAFLKYLIENDKPGYRIYNYVDGPDFTMNHLINQVREDLGHKRRLIRIPESIGMLGGFIFDAIAFFSKKKTSISSVRVKKFCATTQFSAKKIQETSFERPYNLREGLKKTLIYEFVQNHGNGPLYYTE